MNESVQIRIRDALENILKAHFHSEPMLRDKTERMKKLDDKICEGEVDEEILPIIEKINSNPNYFTTSSWRGKKYK